MHDIHISMNDFLAGVCWALGLLLILFDIAAPGSDNGFGRLGIYISGVGGILTMRRFIHEVEQRERRAFRMGREHDRTNLRQLH